MVLVVVGATSPLQVDLVQMMCLYHHLPRRALQILLQTLVADFPASLAHTASGMPVHLPRQVLQCLRTDQPFIPAEPPKWGNHHSHLQFRQALQLPMHRATSARLHLRHPLDHVDLHVTVRRLARRQDRHLRLQPGREWQVRAEDSVQVLTTCWAVFLLGKVQALEELRRANQAALGLQADLAVHQETPAWRFHKAAHSMTNRLSTNLTTIDPICLVLSPTEMTSLVIDVARMIASAVVAIQAVSDARNRVVHRPGHHHHRLHLHQANLLEAQMMAETDADRVTIAGRSMTGLPETASIDRLTGAVWVV